MGVTTAAKEVLNAAEIAVMLDCTRQHIYRLESKKAMPRRLKFGRPVRWRRVEILKWLEMGCPGRGK